MHGCCLGDTEGLGSFPWGYLGQDATELDTQVSTLDTATLGEPGGILAPDSPVTVADLTQYANTGTASDPSILGQLSTLFNAAGPAVQTILQQVQLGQISSSAPLSQNPLLRAAVVSGSSIGSTISNTVASLTSNPLLLLGIGAIAFMVLRKK